MTQLDVWQCSLLMPPPPRGAPNLVVPPAFLCLLTGSQSLGHPPRKAIIHFVGMHLISFWVLHGFVLSLSQIHSCIFTPLQCRPFSPGPVEQWPPDVLATSLPAQALRLSC